MSLGNFSGANLPGLEKSHEAQVKVRQKAKTSGPKERVLRQTNTASTGFCIKKFSIQYEKRVAFNPDDDIVLC
jgi:hypothetical protein